MFFKVSSVHVYVHQDDDTDQIENCSICELAIENQQAEFLDNATVVLDFVEILQITSKPNILSAQTFVTSVERTQAFCRPPPSLV